eukprot:TRINITY_DN10462_c0_g1_i1.p1 TRINITY_DN10462_c0_g1~~TRINITY_DN10462_c0_g1_i1.p1  ORF type:complete len:271 (+),score=45.75 TRINITY_DN10462_c0_g1_i1:174-986(+)
MGICKCRKRTDLWCFVHRKPVCHSCITEHTNCVVKSYVEWLTDPDYEQPTCTLCKHQITPDNAIRLTCLDVFHPVCLDNYAASFPAHTALAGYTCPTCAKPIIPSNETLTPLVQSVKDYLQNAAWVQKLGGVQAIDASIGGAVVLPISGSGGSNNSSSSSIAAIPVTDITPSSYSRKAQRSMNVGEMTPDEEEEDKYSKRPITELFTNMGLSNESKKGKTESGAVITTRSRRPMVSTRRILVLFSLVSTFVTAVVLYLSLSVDPSPQDQQ